jgi:hypothetical protein
MEEGVQDKIEEWKVVRSTIVEFDHILSKIRSLDITATMVILGFAFQYSKFIFILVSALNFCLLLLEIHYHKYLNDIANYAKELEDEIGFKLTHKLSLTRDAYKGQNGKDIFAYIIGSIIANVYYLIYIGFIIIGILLFLLGYTGVIHSVENNPINVNIIN